MKRRSFLQGSLSMLALSTAGANIALANTLTVPDDLAQNPLLRNQELPVFDFKPQDVVPAIKFLIDYNKSVIDEIAQEQNPTWQNFYWPLEAASDRLYRAWLPVEHLASVMDTDDMRKAHEDAQALMTNYETWVGLHRPLYEGYVRLQNAPEHAHYNAAQKTAIFNALRGFKRSGIHLNANDAARYQQIEARLSELSNQFEKNSLDAESAFDVIITDKKRVAGISQAALAEAASSAKAKGKKGWRFTLDYPSYIAVMTRARDAKLREQMYTAMLTVASDKGPHAGKWDNTPVMREILALRDEKAKLLGYENFAYYALETRMAKTPKRVTAFLRDLMQKSRDKGFEEMNELRAHAKSMGIDEMQMWDIGYVSADLKKQRYSVDNEKVREYFPVQKAIDGLFLVANRVFGVTAKIRDDIKTYHPDVKFYDLYNDKGELIAGFYLDMYARDGKRSGAWMNQAISPRILADGTRARPIALINMNATKGADGEPALLYHGDVETLFHEFGHGLHLMLTAVNVADVSGTNVAWDVVEFPSQMMEGWTMNEEVLPLISSHYKTKESLPKDLVDKMNAAKTFGAGRTLMRQLEYAMFDFMIHNEYDDRPEFLEEAREYIKRFVGVQAEPSWTRMANSFGHIFSGGYAAGYYSYLWAEVLAVDAYKAFEREGVFNRKFGQKFVDAFLSKGGSEDPMKLYVDFMGREPDVSALLKERGIV